MLWFLFYFSEKRLETLKLYFEITPKVYQRWTKFHPPLVHSHIKSVWSVWKVYRVYEIGSLYTLSIHSIHFSYKRCIECIECMRVYEGCMSGFAWLVTVNAIFFFTYNSIFMIMDASLHLQTYKRAYIHKFISVAGTIKKVPTRLVVNFKGIFKIISRTFKLFIFCVAIARGKIIQPKGLHIFKHDPMGESYTLMLWGFFYQYIENLLRFWVIIIGKSLKMDMKYCTSHQLRINLLKENPAMFLSKSSVVDTIW